MGVRDWVLEPTDLDRSAVRGLASIDGMNNPAPSRLLLSTPTPEPNAAP